MADDRRARGRRRRSRLAAGALTIALAATGCSAVSSLAARQAPSGAASSSTGSDVPALGKDLGGNSIGSPGTAVPPNPAGPPKDPFAGTPADNWADGAAGIAAPKPEPVGGYTKAQAEYAYQTTKKLLVAAYLDKQTLLGGPPTAFEDLLTSRQRTWFVSGLNKKGVDKAGFPLSTRAMITSFAPGNAQLIGSVVKVHGSMTAKTSVSQGEKEFDVNADYIFTYPIEPPGRQDQWMRVVIQAKWTVAFSNWQGAATNFAPWVSHWQVDRAGIICGTTDGYVHPAYPAPVAGNPSSSASPTGTPVNPYELGQHFSAACQKTTGT